MNIVRITSFFLKQVQVKEEGVYQSSSVHLKVERSYDHTELMFQSW